MAEKQTVPQMKETPGEELTPELVMLTMSLIRQTLYKVENEPKYEVHSRSCLAKTSDPFTLTPADIVEFFGESEDSESQVQEDKPPPLDPSKGSPEKSSK
ncbi:hypothetical protein RHGRI_031018 [Rhododendron griersonianum]|uniref:Uncharacterized protein n=1 Tax=Rhododendron griersonianum TaxID=479676 RepID=A0AAV6I6Q3_9ERIC|nr:hypothetical protein RHGRI_031018 [Rhododendron griersonianum]